MYWSRKTELLNILSGMNKKYAKKLKITMKYFMEEDNILPKFSKEGTISFTKDLHLWEKFKKGKRNTQKNVPTQMILRMSYFKS